MNKIQTIEKIEDILKDLKAEVWHDQGLCVECGSDVERKNLCSFHLEEQEADVQLSR